MSALAHMGEGQKTNMGFIVMLYMLGNLFSALVSVIACRLFPITLTLAEAAGEDMAPPSGVGEVLKNLLMNVVCQSGRLHRKCQLYRNSGMGLHLSVSH
ncbi:MAG: hypothetical protein ACLUUG_13635 [Lachnospiraceae bacterium]